MISRTLWQLNQSSGANNFFLVPEEIFPCLMLANAQAHAQAHMNAKSNTNANATVVGNIADTHESPTAPATHCNNHFVGIYIKLIGKEYNIHMSGRDEPGPDCVEYHPKSGLKIEYCLYDLYLEQTQTGEVKSKSKSNLKSRKKFEYSMKRIPWDSCHSGNIGGNSNSTSNSTNNSTSSSSVSSSIPMRKEKLFVPITLHDMHMVRIVIGVYV